MAQDHKPILGAAIAAAMALYAISSERRRCRISLEALAGNGNYGRHAEEPQHIPVAGWRDILKRVFADITRDNVSLMSAGVAFYALLSLAPAFTALVALYGLVFDTASVQSQVAGLEGLVPQEARQLLTDQLDTIVQGGSSKLGVGLVLSLAIALWSANSATSAMMSALNVAYGEREKRSLLRYYGTALALTLCGILAGIVMLLLIAVIPVAVDFLPLGHFGQYVVSWSRWPILLLLFGGGLAVLYRYGPSRTEPRWSWVSSGALAATILWLVGSALFSLYVSNFATYNRTYGSLGAVVVLLMWFWVSAFAVLLGAELNAEMEHQTMRDTTERPRKPMGYRGAYVADTVARRS